MASDDHFPGFVPGRGYTQEDWNEVSDNPEITPEQAAASKPLAETMPELVAAMTRGRGNPRAPTKDLVTLRIDKDVLATFRASGSGWQSRANEMLRKGLRLDDEEPGWEQSEDAKWLADMTDTLRRIFAGEEVAQDEVRQMAEVVQRHMVPYRSILKNNP